jgi:hypothetical protein
VPCSGMNLDGQPMRSGCGSAVVMPSRLTVTTWVWGGHVNCLMADCLIAVAWLPPLLVARSNIPVSWDIMGFNSLSMFVTPYSGKGPVL